MTTTKEIKAILEVQRMTVQTLTNQGYAKAYANELAIRWYPTPAQERIAKTKMGRRPKNGNR
jgi:hypothetical protein